MARIRTVKPEFWLNEELALLPAETRLLAIGLLNQSDDEGYFRAHPTIIKAAIFPFTEGSITVPEMLRQLCHINYIQVTNGSDGKPYGRVVTFAKHQVVNRPSKSKIKDLCEFSENSVNAHGIFSDASLPERKGKEQGKGTGKGREHELSQPPAGLVVVFDYWKQVMGKGATAKLTPKREKAIKAMLKLGYTVDQIKQAIDGCKASPFHQGQNERMTVYDDVELICRSGEKLESFISCVGAGAGVETIDQFRTRVDSQAARVAAMIGSDL